MLPLMKTTKPRAGGRAARKALRSLPPRVNPAPPGQFGGQYQPLSEGDIRKIYACALRILSEIGIGTVPEALEELLLKAGAQRTDNNRVIFSTMMVEEIINGAAKSFIFHGRDPLRSIEVGGKRVFFGTGGAAVQTLDLKSHRYRPSSLHDLYDFARLQDGLENISWFTRCCIATDIEDIFALDVNTVYALLRGTTKPIATAFTLAEHVPPIVEMLDLVAGGPGAFAKRPFLKAHISPVISPLRFGEDAVAVTMACVAHGIPISAITAAQSGATSPATLAGALASSLAETLASLIMVNVLSPGFPMIFSNWPFVIDLRTGAFSGGSGESTLLNAASAQIINWIGLPSGVAASMTDAKIPDVQYGVEKGTSALGTALAGGNLIYESAGMTASLLGASFEGFLLDNEMQALVHRILRGIEVNDEMLGFDAIKESVLGEGHFLGHAHTRAAMERDYVYPALYDRETPALWEEKGARSAWESASQEVQRRLAQPDLGYIDPQTDRLIRDRFPIMLEIS